MCYKTGRNRVEPVRARESRKERYRVTRKDGTVFPCSLKVECSYETFCDLTWPQVKTQLPLTYMEKF